MSLYNDCSLFDRPPPLEPTYFLNDSDPFQHIDPVDSFSEILELPLLFPEAGHDEVNERYNSDSDDDYVLDPHLT